MQRLSQPHADNEGVGAGRGGGGFYFILFYFSPTCQPPLLIVITKGKWEGTGGARLWFTGVMVSISHSPSLLLGKSLAPWFIKMTVQQKPLCPQKTTKKSCFN